MKWTKQQFMTICQRRSKREVVLRTGKVCAELLGIHQTYLNNTDVWSITHIPSGWNCLYTVSLEGAETIAEYLISHYENELREIKLKSQFSLKVENIQVLTKRLKADKDLRLLFQNYGYKICRKSDAQMVS